MEKLIYNGALFCGGCGCGCPVVIDNRNNTVTINDPAKPQNGSYTMTTEEYNTLLQNAKPI